MLSSAHKINVAQLLVAAGQVADIKIDRIIPGPIHIDRLSLQGISADLKSAKALLKSVRVLLELRFSLDGGTISAFGATAAPTIWARSSFQWM